MKVAVIDRGIDATHRRLRGAKVSGLTIKSDGAEGVEVIDGHFDDDDGHGTAIGSIIYRLNSDVEIVSVKLQGKADVISEELLAAGISYCAGDREIKIINVSLGVLAQNPSRKLVEACESARKNNKIIIAASYPYPEKKCYPASFPYVFSVGTGLVSAKSEYRYVGEGRVNILAKGTTQRVAWSNNSFKISAGTSYATAHFSGILSLKLQGAADPGYEEIVANYLSDSRGEIEELTYLKDYEIDVIGGEKPATLGVEWFTPYHNIQFAGRVAVFPYTEKENKSLLVSTHHPAFEVTAYIDYPRSFSKISGFDVDNADIKNKIIRRTLQDDDFEAFDTLVVGYYLEQTFNANVIFGNRLVAKCISLNKNFIVWDRHVYNYINKVIEKMGVDYKGQMYYPKVDRQLFAQVKGLQYLPKVKTPVIGVIGTSSKQGKVTTQLRLRQILNAEGYKVSHLCTEPQGVVLGAEFSFPFGFKSTVELPGEDWPAFLDVVMRAIQAANEPHVIVSGIQGELIPRRPVDSGGCALSSLNYITSIGPDAVVCAINPMDDEVLIRNTVDTLRKFINFKLLFYVITPWYRDFLYINDNFISNYKTLNKEEYRAKIEAYEKVLDAPVLDILDVRNDALILERIQQAFS